MVFDVTRKATYKNLQKWWTELQDACKGLPVLVVANKIDEDSSVTGKSFAFAENNKLPLLFVSASNGTNVVRVRCFSGLLTGLDIQPLEVLIETGW
jgi:Rab-like protein 2